MFSKACEYAIRATLYIAGATANDQRVTVKDIASEVNAPEAFTAKILQKLVRILHRFCLSETHFFSCFALVSCG